MSESVCTNRDERRLSAKGRRFRVVAELTQSQVSAAMLIYHLLQKRGAANLIFEDETVDRFRLLVDQDDPEVHALEIHRKRKGWEEAGHAWRHGGEGT